MTFCVAFATIVFGVYATKSFSHTYKGNITYNVDYGFLDIQTSVYKYTKNTLTQAEAELYFNDFSEMELVSEYSHHYCTYDENTLMKQDIEDQNIQNFNLDYGKGTVYFVVVNVKSISAKKIQATITSTHNVQNCWSTNTGDVFVENDGVGKTIIFASGITNPLLDCTGSFSYNIDFVEVDG